ncbi:MAG: hypothetical protein K2P84_06805, partial [Undibacterium sp.]|nr:hypothetical protein [Undibacterium sp.]
MNKKPPTLPSILRALIFAALFLGATLAIRLLSPEYLSAELAQRLLGVMMGCVVIFYSNVVPKTLTPLTRMRCDPNTEQSIRRFTGWSLVLGGLGYAV